MVGVIFIVVLMELIDFGVYGENYLFIVRFGLDFIECDGVVLVKVGLFVGMCIISFKFDCFFCVVYFEVEVILFIMMDGMLIVVYVGQDGFIIVR